MIMIAGIIAAVLFLAGAVYMTKRAMAENKGKKSWPSVQGMVTSSGIREISEGTGADRKLKSRYVVEYSYPVAGKTLNGNLYTENRLHFLQLGEKYRISGPVTVFYNPEIPSHNDIKEPLGHSGNISYMTIAIILFVLAIVSGAAGFVVKH